MITIFNFNHFDQNPIVQYCLDSYKDKQVLTEKDVKDIIPHLKHSKWALENKKWSFVGDELRLYLSTLSDDFTYVDADCRVLNIDELNMNKCCLEPDGVTNDGSFFRANNKTQWTKQLVEIYETMPEKDYETVNYILHKEHPEIKIPTQPLNYSHYFLSWFGRLAKSLKSPCIYYTLFWDRAVKELYKGHDVIWLNTAASQTYFSKYNATIWRYFIIPMDLFQAQLDYSCGRHISLINLDNTIM